MIMSKKQKLIAASFLSDKDYLLFDGGVRTGKTLFGLYSFIDLTVINTSRPKFNSKDDNTYAVLGKNFRNLTETLQPIMIDKLKGWGIYPSVTSFGLMYMVNGVTVRLLYYGAKDKGSISSIQGLTARAIFADEAAVLNRQTLEMAISRTVTYDDAKFFFTSNPEGGVGHWYYKNFINNKKINKYYIHMTMHDNPILTEKKIESISGAFTGSMYKQKVLGLWVVAEGAVYPNMVKLTKDEVLDYKIITIGLDEGRKDATVLVAWGYYEKDDTWHAFDMFYDNTANGDINKQATRITVWLQSIRDVYRCPIRVVCETNPGNMHNLLKVHKQRPNKIIIEYVTKKKDFKQFGNDSAIKQRIDLVNMMMNTNKLVIHKKAYKYYSALSNAMYSTKGIRIDDGSSDIDTLDAAEYGLKPYLKIITNRIYKEIGLGKQS